MAEPLVDTRDIKTTLLTDPEQLSTRHVNMYYDEYVDALTLLLIPTDEEWTVHYVDEHVGFIYLAESFELVGIYIEGVQHGFIEKHEELSQVWQEWVAAVPSENGARMVSASLYFRLVSEIIRAVYPSVSTEAPELAAVFA